MGHAFLQLGLWMVDHAIAGVDYCYVIDKAWWDVARCQVVQVQDVYFLTPTKWQLNGSCPAVHQQKAAYSQAPSYGTMSLAVVDHPARPSHLTPCITRMLQIC